MNLCIEKSFKNLSFIKDLVMSFVERAFQSSWCVNSLASFIYLQVRHSERSINLAWKGRPAGSRFISNTPWKLLAHTFRQWWVARYHLFLGEDFNMNALLK